VAKPGSVIHCFNYTVSFNDGPNFYMMAKDIFFHRIYHFHTTCPDPLVLDCGSNIGMSILYFKRVYPGARIVGFEPDPAVFTYLQRNVRDNRLAGIQLVQAAIGGRVGTMTLYADGKYESCLSTYRPTDRVSQEPALEVRTVRLRDHLHEPVEFLKMNIEGAEWEALADSEDRLRQIRQMVVEYHHLPGLPRTLHHILLLLERQGFEYLINGFDGETNPGVRPPFHLDPRSRYFLLIYAKRMD
jgi:FkbM family methyltransferase